MPKKYGVISDIHEDPRIIIPALEILVYKGAEKLLINGDIGGIMSGRNFQEAIEKSQQYTAFILDQIGKSGLESFVQPGSHETLLGFEPVMEWAKEEYSNLHYIFKPFKFEQNDHDLVFIPGSDFLRGGEYHIGNNDKIPSGKYILSEKTLIKFDSLDQYLSALNAGVTKGVLSYANIQDIRNLVNSPEKTIMICHIPRKFENLECVDMAHFFESREYSLREEKYVNHGVFPANNFNPSIAKRDNIPVYTTNISENDIEKDVKIEMWKREADKLKVLVEQKTNRGNEDLRDLYNELGVRKAVSGHFHESSHRAHDSNGNIISPGKFVSELFWNSGHLDLGYTGILTVCGNNVSFENIDLNEYIKK